MLRMAVEDFFFNGLFPFFGSPSGADGQRRAFIGGEGGEGRGALRQGDIILLCLV
jgi:hypothetical protein